MNRKEPRTVSVFSVPGFTAVWLCGFLWHLCRWGVAFLGTYLINDMTGSPRLVQLAGSVLYSPLLIGGLVGGVVSDRFDRKRTVQLQLVSLVPVTGLIGYVVRTGRAEVWMVVR